MTDENMSDYQKAQKWLEGYEWEGDPDADDNLAVICNALQEIEKYKELEKQKRLVKLNCAAGDTIYCPDDYQGKVIPVKVSEIIINESGCLYGNGDPETEYGFRDGDFDKTVFRTEREANKALKKG